MDGKLQGRWRVSRAKTQSRIQGFVGFKVRVQGFRLLGFRVQGFRV